MSHRNSVKDLPPLSYFDISFRDNPGDVLFCSLNEIQPAFLEQESLLQDEFVQTQAVDPRNKLPITQPLHDYTVCKNQELFRSTHRSLLTAKEHHACVGFLQSLRAKQQIFQHNLDIFEETSTRRKNEKSKFLEFLQQYNDANYEKIYAPGLKFVQLYQRLYKWEAQRLMEKYKDGIFQIYTGFPMPRLCGSSEMYGTISDVKVVLSQGGMPVVDSNVDLSKMRMRIETYFETYINRVTEDYTTPVDAIQFEISVEALVLLLCAGEYIDIPAEVIVVAVAGDGGHCVIQINDPLPSRNAGVHTTDLVVDISTEVFLEQGEDKVTEEIVATGFKGSYSLQTIGSFMSKHKTNTDPVVRRSNLVKWNLTLENGEKKISILTRTKSGYKEADTKRQVYHSLKLEYKPNFGSEVPSKVSLIREWIERRLCGGIHSLIYRHRINANTFTTMLKESLSIEDIEQQLEKHYNVKIPRLLGSLGDFLSLWANVNPGRYLLQYNPRFQDKLMLYSEAKDATSKTCIKLHDLLKKEPSDMAFMTLRQLTPIDDMLCTAINDFHRVLPCSFPPWRTAQPNKLIDDRDFIQRKVKERSDILAIKQTKLNQRRKHVKRLKKAKKTKIKTRQKQEEKDDMNELEQDIKRDLLLYGFKSTDR